MEEIKELVIEEDRLKHIARHKITVKEVTEALSADYVWIKAKLDRFMVIGKTKKR